MKAEEGHAVFAFFFFRGAVVGWSALDDVAKVGLAGPVYPTCSDDIRKESSGFPNQHFAFHIFIATGCFGHKAQPGVWVATIHYRLGTALDQFGTLLAVGDLCLEQSKHFPLIHPDLQ